MSTLSSGSLTQQLSQWVRDTHQQTCRLVSGLMEEHFLGPRLEIVNPFLWELGHVAWFNEKWILRHTAGRPPISSSADALYDSAAIPHHARWDPSFPSLKETLEYLQRVREDVLEVLDFGELSEQMVYFVKLCVFHQDMHTEAFTYTRQTHGWMAPNLGTDPAAGGTGVVAPIANSSGSTLADVEIPGGQLWLGASRDEPFVFDNEQWTHQVSIHPFTMAATTVTQREFLAFVEDGGYRHRQWWSDSGWLWREKVKAENPVYWRKQSNGNWLRRDFEHWVPLEPARPVIHVNWYEAEAYCRWAGRRLPSEAEWEWVASFQLDAVGGESCSAKRRFPWGDADPTPMHANLDWHRMGTVDVGAIPDGDSELGCRQMIGNVWQWTTDTFMPYPGFQIGPYKEYSQPWFGTRKVLRGGSWSTRSRLMRNTLRNFFPPDRRDIWAGFRTCALEY